MEIAARESSVDHTGEILALKAIVMALLSASTNLRPDPRYISLTISNTPIYGDAAAQERIREKARTTVREILGPRTSEITAGKGIL